MPDAERVFTAVDVSNLFKSCREEFGLDARVDFQILSEMVPALRHPHPVRQRLMAYVVASAKQNHHAFSNVLRMFGYQVRERIMQYQKGMDVQCSVCGNRERISKAMRSDWDVGIAVDALDQLSAFDTFVLVSGDGDFGFLLDYLKSKGKKTVVYAFKNSMSQQLYAVADELYVFDKSILHNKESHRGAV